MALKKKKEYRNGTSAEYHRIQRIIVEPYQETKVNRVPGSKSPDAKYATETSNGYRMSVYVNSYASEQIRKTDESLALNSFIVTQNFDKEQFDSADIFKQAYQLLKDQEAFQGSIDC